MDRSKFQFNLGIKNGVPVQIKHIYETEWNHGIYLGTTNDSHLFIYRGTYKGSIRRVEVSDGNLTIFLNNTPPIIEYGQVSPVEAALIPTKQQLEMHIGAIGTSNPELTDILRMLIVNSVVYSQLLGENNL